MPANDDKIEIQNFTSPNWRGRVDRAKYEAMRDALLGILPVASPGMTVAEAKAALLPHLPEALFPGGEKAGWWMKAAQLDLEAKGIVAREETKPMRLHRTGKAWASG
jgi:hypothetical protein